MMAFFFSASPSLLEGIWYRANARNEPYRTHEVVLLATTWKQEAIQPTLLLEMIVPDVLYNARFLCRKHNPLVCHVSLCHIIEK